MHWTAIPSFEYTASVWTLLKESETNREREREREREKRESTDNVDATLFAHFEIL
jgi:hypothetical protein